jgi:hypothetical protein
VNTSVSGLQRLKELAMAQALPCGAATVSKSK